MYRRDASQSRGFSSSQVRGSCVFIKERPAQNNPKGREVKRKGAKMMSGYTSIDNQKVSGSVPAVAPVRHLPSCSASFGFSANSGPDRIATVRFTGGSTESQPTGWMQSLTVGAYKPYFDVDTSDVLERIRDSLFPFRGNFTEKTADNPDLYVPPLNPS
ncbi:hypothetical protein BHE74_00025944 [Ensete ventricosum]|nr:hypothetical protein BHE74_00025944 [Ensete ventricosum]